MPWRETKVPYKIWLSEIILQQTRVEQGLPYYLSFIESYPEVADLAKALEDQVLRSWQGLGYYNRARNLHKTAKLVSDQMHGVFPDSYEKLLSLPGVGPYTAAAIASICYEEEVPVVDGNVIRLVSRHFLMEESVDSSSGAKAITALAKEWIQGRLPSRFNQAMMEMGATVCLPANPKCDMCPVADSCMALRNGAVEGLPLKKAKKSPLDRYLIYHVHLDKGATWIQKRGVQGIWASLYEWPNQEVALGQLTKALNKFKTHEQFEFLHVLSHQRIHGHFIVHHGPAKNANDLIQVQWIELDAFPLPRLMTRFLEQFKAKER